MRAKLLEMGRMSKGRPTPARYRSFKNWMGGLLISLFLLELTLGFVYAWKKGALEWE